MRKSLTSLRNAILEPENTYYPELDETQAWYRFFNREIFNKALPSSIPIKLTNLPKIWGACHFISDDIDDAWLEFHTKFPNKRRFFEIMVHEQVHLYQLKYENVNHLTNPDDIAKYVITHGTSFYAWRPIVEKYHLNLKFKY